MDPFTIREEQITTPKVEEEVKKNSLIQLRFATAVECRRIRISNPSPKFLGMVKTCAKSIGDSFYLSETDLQVLALALEIREQGRLPQIVTDDYSIQNVAAKLDLSFVTLSTFGIKRVFNWIRYCPACHRTYPSNFKETECPICGTQLKRKPKRTYQSLNSEKEKQ